MAGAEPLAARMRPVSLDEVVGQQHLLGEGKMLRRMLTTGQLGSLIFYGPPGTGKTTIARLLASHTRRRFEQGNAALVGVAEVKAVLERARSALAVDGTQTVFFLDEIHRFSRSQQDVLLADVERGVITLVGATTENPFFSVNSALVSRSSVFQLEPLCEADILALLNRALADQTRGLGALNPQVDQDALAHLATLCDGDARRALMALELAVRSEAETEGAPHVTLAVVQDAMQRKAIVYDKHGDQHHDAISAYIKSVRGSDPDAAIYWLAKMIEAGEDPRFIARRIAILASEDIGNADPRAISVAAACYDIVERIGMPEGRIILAQATTYLACAPKSNSSYVAIDQAIADVRKGRTLPVPKHLQNRGKKAKKVLGTGKGYQYAHDGEHAHVQQDYLGVDKTYYRPVDRGFEKHQAAWLAWLRAEHTGECEAKNP